tara:strand:- start:4898 stop:5170 length:273 start_codon:yes stop_codon:yes gene_type:complete
MFSRVLMPLGQSNFVPPRPSLVKSNRKLNKSSLPARTPVWSPALSGRVANDVRREKTEEDNSPKDDEDDFVHAELVVEERDEEDYVWVTE